MWKLQHVEGQREINELHVPVGRDVKLIMTSQDVIHSFYRSGIPHQAGRRAGPLHHRCGFVRRSPAPIIYFVPNIAEPCTPA